MGALGYASTGGSAGGGEGRALYRGKWYTAKQLGVRMSSASGRTSDKPFSKPVHQHKPVQAKPVHQHKPVTPGELLGMDGWFLLELRNFTGQMDELVASLNNIVFM